MKEPRLLRMVEVCALTRSSKPVIKMIIHSGEIKATKTWFGAKCRYYIPESEIEK